MRETVRIPSAEVDTTGDVRHTLAKERVVHRIGDVAEIWLGDCAEIIPLLAAERFAPRWKIDACVTDPPYGIGADEAARNTALQRIKANGKSKAGRGWKDYGDSQWDRVKPSAELLSALLRLGRHQIIWGGNYFTDILPPTMQWLIWDKGQRDFSLADFEMAWSSQWAAARLLDYPRALALQDGKEHPTQKPVAVMKWCIEQLPRDCKVIVDPFMGSGTTGVAAVQMRRKFIGIERDERYFEIAERRITEASQQLNIFEEEPDREPVQGALF